MKRPEALDTLRELEQKASPAPWSWVPGVPDPAEGPLARLVGANGEDVCNFGVDVGFYPTSGAEPSAADQALMNTMRNALPDILAYVEQLERIAQGGAQAAPVSLTVEQAQDVRFALQSVQGILEGAERIDCGPTDYVGSDHIQKVQAKVEAARQTIVTALTAS